MIARTRIICWLRVSKVQSHGVARKFVTFLVVPVVLLLGRMFDMVLQEQRPHVSKANDDQLNNYHIIPH